MKFKVNQQRNYKAILDNQLGERFKIDHTKNLNLNNLNNVNMTANLNKTSNPLEQSPMSEEVKNILN